MADKFLRHEGLDYTRYQVQPSSDSDEPPWKVPTAEVLVSRPHTDYRYNREFPEAAYDEPLGPRPGSHSSHMLQYEPQKYGDWAFDDDGEPLPNHVPGQFSFFTATHKPASVEEMFAHHSLRQHLPALIGMAAKSAGWPTNPVVASESLSDHSQPIVDRMVDRGLLTPRQGGHHHNYISDNDPEFREYMATNNVDYERYLPPSQAVEGRKLYRNAMRMKPYTPSHSADIPRQPVSGESVKGKQFKLWGE
jgi:hypothetical protein